MSASVQPTLPFEPAAERRSRKRLDFDGAAYERQHDQRRLTTQLDDIFALMRDGEWRTLAEIARLTHHHEASISAQLRHLRKPRFGAHTIEKRRRGAESSGLWEYRLLENKDDAR